MGLRSAIARIWAVARLVAALAAVGVVVAVGLHNTADADIDLIWWSGTVPLWLAGLGAGAAGALVWRVLTSAWAAVKRLRELAEERRLAEEEARREAIAAKFRKLQRLAEVRARLRPSDEKAAGKGRGKSRSDDEDDEDDDEED
jgi:uncharacterized integral membrane protein